VQHDTANYGSGLGAGRGILVAVFHYNANDTSQGIWAQTFGYNLAGETVWTRRRTRSDQIRALQVQLLSRCGYLNGFLILQANLQLT